MRREILVVVNPNEPLVVAVVDEEDELVPGHEVALLH